jgi:hypothetical protein
MNAVINTTKSGTYNAILLGVMRSQGGAAELGGVVQPNCRKSNIARNGVVKTSKQRPKTSSNLRIIVSS